MPLNLVVNSAVVEHFIIDNFVQKEGKVLSLGIPTRDSLRRP